MGSRHSKVQSTGSEQLRIENTKLISHQTNLTTRNSKKENRKDSADSNLSSDNESFSFVVKHKTHDLGLKKGLHNSIVNHSKNGNNLDWDLIANMMNTETNEGIVIIKE
ncbi:hypothetical protein FG386_002566 [Cryptosporidium ryanae]|uniref:uncharacterized protein n=1 Tax=Cryptosporidium ryanae TaxID=515981 RepID=UPI00351A33C8|nr:hypothetical protein FG386_002566 [Cryptosporidium ryanae]